MRIRTIKPEFWMHEGLCSKSDFTRLLAIALLNWADDEGYFMANPVLIRGQVFPFLDDSKTIPRSLSELSAVGWIELGKDDEGRAVGRIINFAKHQRVDKPKSSTIKDKANFQEESKNHPGIIRDSSKEEGKGREEEGNGTLSAEADAEAIFQAYPSPRRGGRKEAFKAIRAALRDIAPAALLASVSAYSASREVRDRFAKGEAAFVPLLATWLNKGRYSVESAPVIDEFSHHPDYPPDPPRPGAVMIPITKDII